MIETATQMGIIGVGSLALVFVSFFSTIYVAKKVSSKNEPNHSPQ
jgi:hypothetical protein